MGNKTSQSSNISVSTPSLPTTNTRNNNNNTVQDEQQIPDLPRILSLDADDNEPEIENITINHSKKYKIHRNLQRVNSFRASIAGKANKLYKSTLNTVANIRHGNRDKCESILLVIAFMKDIHTPTPLPIIQLIFNYYYFQLEWNDFFSFTINSKLDVRDLYGNWYKCKIVNRKEINDDIPHSFNTGVPKHMFGTADIHINKRKKYLALFVNYLDWEQNWNEWIFIKHNTICNCVQVCKQGSYLRYGQIRTSIESKHKKHSLHRNSRKRAAEAQSIVTAATLAISDMYEEENSSRKRRHKRSIISTMINDKYSTALVINEYNKQLLRRQKRLKEMEEFWECQRCTLHNNGSSIACFACHTPKPMIIVDSNDSVVDGIRAETVMDVIDNDNTTIACMEYGVILTNDEQKNDSNDEIDEHRIAKYETQSRTSLIYGVPTKRGCVGLVNFGNSSSVNCILQCLSNTPLVRKYFRSGVYLNELVLYQNELRKKTSLVLKYIFI